MAFNQPKIPLFDEAFVRGNRIGTGSFGDVFECIPTHIGEVYLRSSGHIEAGKLIPNLVVKSPKGHSNQDTTRELEALQSWQHRGIVQFFGEFQSSDGRRHLVLEAIQGIGDGPFGHLLKEIDKASSSSGELWRYIATRDIISDGEFRIIAFQILSAVNYLHQHNVAHRDLKTENMLCGFPMINTAIGSAPTVKLSDFGTARALTVEDQFGLRPNITAVAIVNGTERWMGTTQFIAPELLHAGAEAMEEERKKHGKSRIVNFKFLGAYNTKCDIYSLGVTFFFMLTKSMPYFNMNNPEEIFDFVKLGATSPKCRSVMSRLDINQETIDLVLRMLVSDPSTRPSTEQLLNDSYFDSIRNSF